MCELLGRPQDRIKALHVAGTNGKGSTCLMLARSLTACGYRTGLFVSPHVHSYRERIQIDGSMIGEEELADCLNRVDACLRQLLAEGYEHPTEFEVLTAAALLYFAEKRVELAVIEVGMGGLYDSTNVVSPVLCVITNIEFDHMAFLGTTIEEIAANKAGIIKAGAPVVTGERKPQALKVLKEKAAREGTELIEAMAAIRVEVLESRLDGQRLWVEGMGKSSEIELGLIGSYQRENVALVWASLIVMSRMGYEIDWEEVKRVLAICRWPGRLEVVQKDPLIILDAGHNEAGARAMRRSLEELLPGKGKVAVIGILDDKDADPFIQNLPLGTRLVIVTRPDSPRAVNWEQRADLARRYYPEVVAIEKIEEAVDAGLNRLKPDEVLIVTGSFYVLDRARRHLLKKSGLNLA